MLRSSCRNYGIIVIECRCKRGKRFALPYARIMIHQPLGGAQGQSADIQIQAKEILRLREIGNKYFS